MPAINTLLAVRSYFSLGESILSPKQIAAAAKDLGNPDVVICDTMSVNSLVETSRLASDEFKPRFGVSLRLVDDATAKVKKQPTHFLKVYPHDHESLQIIFRLLSIANSGDNFYYVPRLDIATVCEELAEGNFTVSTGDLNGILEHPDHRNWISQLEVAVGADNVWIEMSPVGTGYHDRVNAIAAELCKGGMKPLATMPVLYTDGGYEAFVTNMAIQSKATVAKPGMMRKPAAKTHIPLSQQDYLQQVKDASTRLVGMGSGKVGHLWKQAIGNQAAFLSQLTYKWQKQPVSLPELSATPDAELKRLCVDGLKKRMASPVFGEQIDKSRVKTEYVPRLTYELNVLKTMGFAPYFLVVDELVRWCKDEGILVGPGRGSVGGSLVAYLMGITDVDPIRFGLIFERFINPSRRDLPDIDLDFMSTRRQDVIGHLVEKYGHKRVAGLSNYSMLGSASGLKDASRVFALDAVNASRSKLIPKVHGQPVDLETAEKDVAEISQFADDNPEVWKAAVALQGVLRLYGKHASGIIVAGDDLENMAVVERRSGEGVVNWDGRAAEDMGLVKLDILGLSTLDTISRTMDYIKQRHSKVPDILAIPLDDEPTLKAFSEGETVGVFQFEGGAARRILKDMAATKPLEFDDIIAANALNRPGPIDAGLVEKYTMAKNELEENELAHPNMEEALSPTYNVIVYQEQVMKVAVDLSGFSLADADGLRKAMGKKLPEEMAKYKSKFVEGAVSHSGMDRKKAENLFEQIEVFAGYAFNKSHAAEYSLISYQCMWLKVHYPVEFFAAAFSTVKEDKLGTLLENAIENGIQVLPPDINVSEHDFVILNDTTLVTPFNRVKSASDRSASAIMQVRASGKITSQEDLRKRLTDLKLGRNCNRRVIENLNAVGAFANVEPGQKPPLDESRIKDKLVLMPGLVSQVLVADRQIPRDKFTNAALRRIMKEVYQVDEDAVHALPAIGKKPKFMVVADCPSWSEEAAKRFASGKSFNFMSEALAEVDMSKADAYWTGLLKTPKADKLITPEEIKRYGPFLTREIELLKPPVILTLGSTSARFFLPDLKGSVLDNAGSVHYLPKLDTTLVIGFNPSMIFHEPSRKDTLIEVLLTVSALIEEK